MTRQCIRARLAVLAAGAAVAAVAVPVAVLAGRDDLPGPADRPAAAMSTDPEESPTPTAEPTDVVGRTKAPPPSPSRPAAQAIADDFPLAAGWPADDAAEPGPKHGLHGPARDLEPLRLEACGTTYADPVHADRLLAEWSNVEDFRVRQLTTYDDPPAAAAALAGLLDLYWSCPRQEEDAYGYTTVISVRPLEVGDESWAVVRGTEYDGAPTVGLEVLLVVRVGHSVLVDTAANEGGGGGDPDADVRLQVLAQTDGSADVVAAMCALPDAGC